MLESAHRPIAALIVTLTLGACVTVPDPKLGPVAVVDSVDLPRFMGDWYVIASIATRFERGAHNARDSYRLDSDGTIPTTFTFNADGFDGKLKQYESRGFVVDGSHNAVWGQQYVWPFKADYRISYLSPDYQQVVVMRDKRDYVWIMSRSPTMPEADLAKLTAFVASQGYDASKLQRVPQRAR